MSPDNDLEREILQLEQRYAENAHGLVFAHLADAYRRAGEYSKAEGLLLHGLKSHPSYTSAYNVLGRVYLDSERYEDAHAQFARVLELDPHNLISLRALGDIAARRGHLADAREWYERMLQIDPRSEEARDGLAKLTPSPEAPPAPEPAAGDVPPLSREPESIGFEEPEPYVEAVRETPPEATGAHEPPTAEFEDRGLETVEKIRAEVEPVEGLMDGGGIDAASMDDVSGEFGEGDVFSFDEDQDVEPWAVDEPYQPSGAPEGAADSEVRREPELDEPWLDSAAGQADQEPPELAEERAEEEDAEPWLTPETDSLELRSMDDWSPGFVVGELLDGQATEELRPDEILEGLDAEYMFETGEEPMERPDLPGSMEEERAGEGVVTETMAELYASQGLYADALAVYQRLAEANPYDERLRSRIVELERRVGEAAESATDEDELVRLMRLTETDEEARPEAPAVDETASEIEAEVFGFEDEVPVAGFEQLDPFASSFDTLAAKAQSPESILEEAPRDAEPAASERDTGPGPLEAGESLEGEGVPVESLESEPVPIESLESEPVPVESLAEEPAAEEPPGSIEGIDAGFAVFGQTVDESPADVAREEESEEPEYMPADEGITAVDSIWELTDVGASQIREGAAEQPVDEMAEESDEVDVPVRIDGGNEMARQDSSSTIEDYVNTLLSFDVESLFEASQSSAGSQEDEPPSRPESSSPEDLEQFQEWLKSLKR